MARKKKNKGRNWLHRLIAMKNKYPISMAIGLVLVLVSFLVLGAWLLLAYFCPQNHRSISKLVDQSEVILTADDFAYFAVDEYNKKQSDEEALEVARVVKLHEQVACLTIEIIDAAGEKKLYKAKLLLNPDLYGLKQLLEFKPLTPPHLLLPNVKKLGGWQVVSPHDPPVQDAVNFAVQILPRISNCQCSYQLLEIIHAKAKVDGNVLKFDLLLKVKKRTPGVGVQHVLDYLKRMQAENPAFYYEIQNNGENHQSGGNVFWADGMCRMNYSCFGDTVVFDTTYRTNQYRVPFAAFTGFNHHGQPVLFGCGLVLFESESSFIWLFQTWLQAMSGHHPISITTDPDRLIQVAVAQVLHGTRHRFCKWAIFRETQEKLSHLCQSHPTFETEFKKCINESETINEFESCWGSLLNRYYIMDNEWLQLMYSARQQWVPVYMKDTFFGELSNESYISLHLFFDGYVTASTTIHMMIKQYEKAMASWHEKELKADYDTTNSLPVLKTPSPMEKQAADLYTRRIFRKFQEELVETLANPATKIDDTGTVATYRVAKFGEDHKAHAVSFNSSEMKANCSCQLFEYSGIICRHMLAVFKAKNVLTLPSQYVLKRWTRNARSGAAIDDHSSELPNESRDSLTVRYSSLRQEAIKYVEEGAKSIHIYNVAMDALKEASKKIAAVKNRSPRAANGDIMVNGGVGALVATEENQAETLQSVDQKEKKIRELSAELEKTNQRCEVYRANLLAVLKDMEDQKLKLSVKVQNARLSMKE